MQNIVCYVITYMNVCVHMLNISKCFAQTPSSWETEYLHHKCSSLRQQCTPPWEHHWMCAEC